MTEQLPTLETDTAPILEVERLSKYFPVGNNILPGRQKDSIRAVEDVSFALRKGSTTALVGESGSGKSTVARLLAGLYPPTAGTVYFHGEPVRIRSRKNLLRYCSQVQMIFQDPFGSLNPVKRVEHHIARPLRIHRVVPSGQVHERVLELLTRVGLSPAEEFADKYPHQLSGGQRQRVAIARTLAVEPQVLLADEPISMLDVSIRIGVLNLILDLKQDHDIAFLYITHDIASARYVADEVMVMYKGHIVERGQTDAVLLTPWHPYTQLLLSAVPNPERGLTGATMGTRQGNRNVEDPVLGSSHNRAGGPQLVEVEPGHWVRAYA